MTGGVRFSRTFGAAARATETPRSGAGAEVPATQPPATLFLPLRGVDPGLEENLTAFFQQTYVDQQLVFVADSADDPGLAVARRVRERFPDSESRLLVAGAAVGRGQKVHNLLAALDQVRPRDQVLAFGDSDVRPRPSWLGDLVRPLADPTVGASTGFRWHVPQRGGYASVLRSVWNAGIVSLMTGRRPPFAWGGALALRRDAFEAAGVRERWQGALSDDYVVTHAIEATGLRIHFEPRALSFTREDCTLRQLLDWSFRQLAITRIYRPALWRAGLFGELFGNLTLWGGILVLGVTIGRVVSGGEVVNGFRALALGGLLGGAYAARGLKADMRLRGVLALFPEETGLRRWRWAYVLGTPIASLVTLLGLLRSATTRQISWRGIRYRMISPSRTEVLSRQPAATRHDAD